MTMITSYIDAEDMRFVANFLDMLNEAEKASECAIEEIELDILLQGDLCISIKRSDNGSWCLAV